MRESSTINVGDTVVYDADALNIVFDNDAERVVKFMKTKGIGLIIVCRADYDNRRGFNILWQGGSINYEIENHLIKIE